MATETTDSPLLKPGKNCWRIEHADRFALIVDAAGYFVAAKEAMLAAQHSIYLIGWDFDTRMAFEPEEKMLEGPNKLGPFLRWLDRNRPNVEVHVLKWDVGALMALGRGTTPLAILDWVTSRRIHFKLDGAHPTSAAHHQKIVVIDDRLAFCGGIDMTTDRWDTREHIDKDPRRRRPTGRRYGPWHDATALVDGRAAAALGELVRARWKFATGETIPAPPARAPFWPRSVAPDLADIEVAIARTAPEYGERAEIREIEAFYLDAIARARRMIYCESQYFASRRIAEAIAERLAEPDGPDVVIVNPESADGFLETITMDTARARLLSLVDTADIHRRFRIYSPVTAGGEPIYVHAKILVIDDALLRVGSSNLNNRSMGFDTECDLIIEADGQKDAQDVRERIAAIRNDLLAEHLGVAVEDVASALRAQDESLSKAVDSLIDEGRSLAPYEPGELAVYEAPFAENELLDPERPPSLTRKLLKLLSLHPAPVR